MPPRLTPKTSVPVSLTALLCSPSLSWEAALSCYYAFQSQGQRKINGAATFMTTTSHEGKITSYTMSPGSGPHVAASAHPTVWQQQLRRQVEEVTEEKPAGKQPCFSADQGNENPRITPEAVFCLYRRLIGTSEAQRFLLHACERDPLLIWLWHNLTTNSGVRGGGGETLLANPADLNPCAVLSCALTHLLAESKSTAAEKDGAVREGNVVRQMIRLVHHCQEHHLTRDYVRDFALAIRVSKGESAMPPIPYFDGFLRQLLRRWEIVLCGLKDESQSGYAVHSTGGDEKNCAAVWGVGSVKEKGEESSAAEAARSLFVDEPNGLLTNGKVRHPSSGEGRGSQEQIRELSSDSLAAVSFTLQLRLCRWEAVGVRVDDDAVKEKREDEATFALLRLAFPYCGFNEFASLILAVVHAERHVTSGDLQDSPCSRHVIARAAPLLEFLLAQTIIAAARTQEKVKMVLEAVVVGKNHDGSPAIAASLLPPLSCCPAIIRAVTADRRTVVYGHDYNWLQAMKAAYSGVGDDISYWQDIFFGMSAASSSPMPFPRDLAFVSASFSLSVPVLVHRWAEGCVCVSQRLGLVGGARCAKQVLSSAIAGLAVHAASHNEDSTTVDNWLLLKEVLFRFFLPSLLSQEEHVAVLASALRALAPLRSSDTCCGPSSSRVLLLRALFTPRSRPPGVGNCHSLSALSVTSKSLSADDDDIDSSVRAAVSLIQAVLRRRKGDGALSLEDAALLLKDLLEAIASCPSLPAAATDQFICAFRDTVNKEGLTVERPSSVSHEPASLENGSLTGLYLRDAKVWIRLLANLPRGVVDETHMTVWLYWMMRAVTRAEEALSHTSRKRLENPTDCDSDQSEMERVFVSARALPGGQVCSEVEAISVARNLGAQLVDFPVDAIASPMLLNWLVARVPDLSWSEAASILLEQYRNQEGKQTTSQVKAKPSPFVFLTLPVNRIYDMQHALRVLGSLRFAYMDDLADEKPNPTRASNAPAHENEIHQLYCCIRQGLLHKWYSRSLRAVLVFVTEDAMARGTTTTGSTKTLPSCNHDADAKEASCAFIATQCPSAPNTEELAGAELYRLLRDTRCAITTGAYDSEGAPCKAGTLALPQSSVEETPIKIPLPLLGYYVLQERRVHARFRAAEAARNAHGKNSAAHQGVSDFAAKLWRNAHHNFVTSRVDRAPEGRLPPTSSSTPLALPSPHTGCAVDSAVLATFMRQLRRCGSGDVFAAAAAPALGLPPLDRALGELFVALSERLRSSTDDDGSFLRNTERPSSKQN